MKPPTFAEEREWRLIEAAYWGAPTDLLSFRESAGRVVPFLTLNLCDAEATYKRDRDKLPLRELVHGPTLDATLAIRALENLLRKHAYEKVNVTGSRAPLRA